MMEILASKMMDIFVSKRFLRTYMRGSVFTEGKTKVLHNIEGHQCLVDIESKEDITAGDGAKRDVILGKAVFSNETTCNVFRLLQECAVPLAFVAQASSTSFIARKCDMLPYEVVVRREALGSYLKRNPHLPKGHLFPHLLVEFFLKTSGRRWKEHDLVCDDPLMIYDAVSLQIQLFDPAKPIYGQEPFLVLSKDEVFSHEAEQQFFPNMSRIATETFLILEKAWQIEDRKLVDFKVEFGLTDKEDLVLSDVIDNDSWRVLEDDEHLDKQVYRDGGELDEVTEKYQRVADITRCFHLPRQQIILWRGSEKDDGEPFLAALKKMVLPKLLYSVICSMHKEPVAGASILNLCVQKIPDAVVIAYVGRSNGAGPTLSAMSTVPVITVPASVKGFPDDIWSSLRTPSNVPVMTVLEPANAVLAALQILSARNPRIYATLRAKVERRLINTVNI